MTRRTSKSSQYLFHLQIKYMSYKAFCFEFNCENIVKNINHAWILGGVRKPLQNSNWLSPHSNSKVTKNWSRVPYPSIAYKTIPSPLLRKKSRFANVMRELIQDLTWTRIVLIFSYDINVNYILLQNQDVYTTFSKKKWKNVKNLNEYIYIKFLEKIVCMNIITTGT